MSTAGKVLAVLSVLMLAVWIVLMSAVTKLNTDANKRLVEIKEDIAKLKIDVDIVKRNADETLVKINQEQIAKERDMRLVRIRLSTAERQFSTTQESLTRHLIQLKNATQALETAKQGLVQRSQEKAGLEKNKADEEAVVKQFQGKNDELTNQLVKLRTDFQKALAKNQVEVQKHLKSGKAMTRSASFVR